MGRSEKRIRPVTYIITDPARKDLASLGHSIRQRVIGALDRLLNDPGQADLRDLKTEPHRWRLRVGDWRVIFRYDPSEKIVYVLRIKHRREAYR